jgi:hypothetical protein
MSQFYVPDEDSAKKCQKSRDDKAAIDISGVDDLDGRVKLFSGEVQLVEDFGRASPRGRRWRVTILDSK